MKGNFNCDLCQKNFHRLDQLRRHLHTNHVDQPQAAKQNIERARGWKKEAERHERAGMRASTTSSSVEPPSDIGDGTLEATPPAYTSQ